MIVIVFGDAQNEVKQQIFILLILLLLVFESPKLKIQNFPLLL